MVINRTERVVLEGEMRDLYEAYQHRKASIERVIKERLEREIAAEQGDALRDLSKALHEYHRKGLPKSSLRVATKKYGNNDEFLKLWNAYEPEDSFALAVGRQSIPVFEWRNQVLYIHKNPATSEVLSQVIAAPLYSKRGWFTGTYPERMEKPLKEMVGDYREFTTLALAVNKEIARAFEAGEITESTNPYDYVNDLPESEQASYLKSEEEKNFIYNTWIEGN